MFAFKLDQVLNPGTRRSKRKMTIDSDSEEDEDEDDCSQPRTVSSVRFRNSVKEEDIMDLAEKLYASNINGGHKEANKIYTKLHLLGVKGTLAFCSISLLILIL